MSFRLDDLDTRATREQPQKNINQFRHPRVQLWTYAGGRDRSMTSLHASPGYANTPLAEWQEYPYQALRGGERGKYPYQPKRRNPSTPPFSFFEQRAATQETTRAASQEHATSRNGEPCQGRVYTYESD